MAADEIMLVPAGTTTGSIQISDPHGSATEEVTASLECLLVRDGVHDKHFQVLVIALCGLELQSIHGACGWIYPLPRAVKLRELP